MDVGEAAGSEWLPCWAEARFVFRTEHFAMTESHARRQALSRCQPMVTFYFIFQGPESACMSAVRVSNCSGRSSSESKVTHCSHGHNAGRSC